MNLSRRMVLIAFCTAGAGARAAAAAGDARPATRAARFPPAEGRVLEVDRQERRVLVQHGPIRSLGMGPMAMEFAVPDQRVLDLLKPGYRIRFSAAWKDGDYVITDAKVVPRRARGSPAPSAR